MQLILTHENADFDAIGSLLAAALLYPEAIPVAPHTCNQNVRDFLTLYWEQLPFIEFRDRPKEPLERIIMVDSQYVPAFKGRTAETRLRIIDHHTPGDNLPPQAEVNLSQNGANVTAMVDEIIRSDTPINPIQATLLLLGIYEDTGSLTYSGTTPQDLRSASWLLEQGAQLETLREFLYYALNPEQQALYTDILKNLTTHDFQGNQVMISAVHTHKRVTEISSIAHKLRNLYNPDGLFLLVEMNEALDGYVQLIARSTADTIHVGQIAAAFGGGGHPRAAAAHITDLTLDQANQKLHQILQDLVKPAATVRQIMSFSVRTLSPKQPVRIAADMVTRYGHEGYPVVDGKRIVGILARREIDKAMHHKLGNAAVRQFMHEGEIFVSPDDTIETLQAVMLREQVGQVPVVEDGEIIGVVTRTDLINLWSGSVVPAATGLNLTERLRQALPPTLFSMLKEAGTAAEQIGSTLYLVGGVVRDLLLDRPIADIDLVVEGDAIALARTMQGRYGGRVHSHRRFGTANWITEGAVSGIDRLDFVTARTEFYRHPTALPEVEQSSIKQDLHRRDFTINTLALSLAPQQFGRLLDFYGGYNDLQAGVLRVLHSLSFVEDPTRILRAVRLEQRLGLQIGRRTMEHLYNALDLLSRVTPERVFAELRYTFFREQEPERALLRMDELGVLRAIQPALRADHWFAERCRRLRSGLVGTPWAGRNPETVHYLGLLTYHNSPPETEAIIVSLRIRSNMARLLRQAQQFKKIETELAAADIPSQIYAYLQPFDDDALLICRLACDNPRLHERLTLFKDTLNRVQPEIDGHYLIEHFNLQPSPWFTKILTGLRNARLDGQITTLAEEHRFVERFLADHSAEIKATIRNRFETNSGQLS